MSDLQASSLAAETIRSSTLYNKDLAPVPPDRRTWGTYAYAALWISMSVNIPTYMLASAMIAGGMNWKQALVHRFPRKCSRSDPHVAERARGYALWNSFPGFRSRLLWRVGRQCPGCIARACGLRLVRHSDLDRRRSHQRHAHRAGSRAGSIFSTARPSVLAFSGC